MRHYVLVLNCGSSSIKFAIIDAVSGDSPLTGLAENLGNTNASLKVNYQDKKTTQALPAQCNHLQALTAIEQAVNHYPDLSKQLVAVGHRVVHGGETFTSATLINDKVKAAIENTSHMAPLHNPANLQGIQSAQNAFDQLPHVAVFDTAFFQSMPKTAYLYALPYTLYQEHGIRRYGFHGSSHQFVSQQAADFLGKPLGGCNLITAHLGNGCSIAAIRGGKAVDTSLGFTPLEGLVMGTRCGDLDPSLPGYLQQTLGYSADETNDLLNKASGLLGISELSNDCRALEEAATQDNEQAQLALQVFCYRLAKYIGAYLVVAGKLDALVFTGGIGENSAFIRRTTLAHLEHLGFALDEPQNLNKRFGKSGAIHASNTHTTLVIATNEEWIIAQQAHALTQGE